MRIRLYNPKFRFYKSRGIFPYHSNLLFGFENEVNINEHIITQKGEKKIDDFLRKYPFIYFKEEVGFENGAELNSHPMNWNFYLKNKDFVKDLCDLQNKYFFKSTMQCGFHIHFSRKYFTKKHLR